MKHLHYGWVMVIIAIIVLAAHAPAVYAFGIFLRPLTLEFNWDRGALSGAFSFSQLLFGVLGIFCGRLSDKYGPRILVTLGGLSIGIGFLLMSQVSSLWQIYLIWGIFMGFGNACHFVPITSTIPRWFKKRRGVAVGISVAGIGLGGIISAPLTQWLISSYGWQNASITLGVIILIIIIPLAQFMKHSPQRIGLKPYGEDNTIEDRQSLALTTDGVPLNQAIKTGPFWIFGLVLFCVFFIVQVITVHIVPHAIDIGISEMVAASILSITAVTSIIGRSLIGFACDKIGARMALTACLVTLTLSLTCLLFAQEVWIFYLFAIIFGGAYGGIVPLESLVTAGFFSLKFLGAILGSLILIDLIGAALGPLSAGIIFDVTGSYSLAFLICLIIGTLSIILSLALLKAKRWRGSD